MDPRISGRKSLTMAARRKKASLAARPTCVDDLSDEVLEMVLLRVHSAACLVRAASVCRRWRRVVVVRGDGGVFLRRFRARHGPDLVGHYHAVVGAGASQAAFVHVSRPVLVYSCRLSLDFVVPATDDSWTIADSRGGLLLLAKKRRGHAAYGDYCPDSLIVCEPITWRYQLVPVPTAEMRRRGSLGAFLADGDADELGCGICISNYRVICVLYKENPSPLEDLFDPEAETYVVWSIVFASGNGGGWRVKATYTASGMVMLFARFTGRAGGSLYWRAGHYNMLALDERTAMFSIVEFPHHMREWPSRKCKFRVVAGDDDDDGEVRVVGLTNDDHLRVFSRLPSNGDWVLKNSLNLSKATRGLPGRKEMYFGCGIAGKIVGGGKGYLLLSPSEEAWLYSVDLRTMEVEREHPRNAHAGAAFPYELPWPPVFNACIEH